MKRLIAAVPVTLFFIAVAAFGCFRIIDTDLWLYLRVGERICRTLEVPRSDVFSYSAAGRPWMDVHWLAQAALWIVWRAGGATGLSLLRLVLVIAVFAVLYRRCRNSAPPALACGVLTLALLVSSDGFLMKPQLFALLLAAVFVASLERPGGTPWLLVPLQALWVNIHPSFLLGPLLVLFYWADARLKPGGSTTSSGARSHLWWVLSPPTPTLPLKGGGGKEYEPLPRDPLSLGVLCAACLCACLATPYGPAVLLQPLEQVFTPLYGKTVIPWTPPSSAFPAPASYFFFKIMLALSAAAFALNARKFRPAHLATAVLFAALSLKSRRHLPLFALLSAPGLSYNLACAATGLRARMPRASRALAAAYTVLLSAALIALSRDVATDEFYFRQRSLKRFGLGRSGIAYPDAAMDFIGAAGVGGRVFCNYDVASCFGARFYPRFTVFIDGRNLVYGEDILRRYLAAMGDLRALDALADEYGVTALLLTHSSRDVRAILPALWKSARWRPVYADDRGVVFLKNGARPDLPRIDLASCALPGVPSAGPFPLAELRAGEFFFTTGLIACARGLFRQALARRAELPEAHNFLGAIAARDGDAETAEEEFRTACAMSRSYAEPRVNLSVVLRARGDCTGAEREARAAVRIAPSSPHAREALGLALLSGGELAPARRELERAVSLDPLGAEYHSNLGLLREREGDPAGAAAAYEKARALSPDYFAPRFNLALLREKSGEDEAAIALYEEALAIVPGHGAAGRNLAALMSRRGRGGEPPCVEANKP